MIPYPVTPRADAAFCVPLKPCASPVAARLAEGPILVVTDQGVPSGRWPLCPRCGESLYYADEPLVLIYFFDQPTHRPTDGWTCPCGVYTLTAWRFEATLVRAAYGLALDRAAWAIYPPRAEASRG